MTASSSTAPFNILFTSAGRRVALIRHFKGTLKELGLNGKILTADLKKDAPAQHISDQSFLVPRVSQPDYLDRLEKICRENQVKLVVPLIDTELHILAQVKERFQEFGTTVLVSSKETSEICLDKRRTSDYFKKVGVKTPHIYSKAELSALTEKNFPVLLKPSDGSCSIGVTRIKNKKELEFFLEYTPNAIVQPLIVGQEFTLDAWVDFEGKVQCVVPRLRMETRAGEVSKGMTVRHAALIEATKQVVESLPGALGCITVQCFLSPSEELEFIEINPRFGGGIPLALAAGADFPRWIIEAMTQTQPSSRDFQSAWKDGVVMLRYDDAVFIKKEDLT